MAQKETGLGKKIEEEIMKQTKLGQDQKRHQQTPLTHYRRPLNPSRFYGLDASKLNSKIKNASSNLARTLFFDQF